MTTALVETRDTPGALVAQEDEQGLRYLIAIDRPQLEAAHRRMIEWAKVMQDRTATELKEEQAVMDVAVKNHWATKRHANACARLEKRIQFYQKIEQALLAGYVLVPNFDMNVFAIRTTAKTPRGQATTSHWQRFIQAPMLLPQGKGEYRNPSPTVLQQTHDVPDGKGGTKKETMVWPTVFEDVEFPVALAKPVLMERTGEAMRSLIFDEIGVAQDTWRSGVKADPIVLGRIRNPRTNRPAVTFFIGWYFDPTRL